MNDSEVIKKLTQILHIITTSPEEQSVDMSFIQSVQSPELKEFCNEFLNLFPISHYAFMSVKKMAMGDLDFELPKGNEFYTPMKDLQSKLKHLVWQTKRLSEGDLNQQIDFLGDFSTSFNQLIASLKERRTIEQALADKNRQFQLIGQNSRDVIWTVNLNTLQFTYISQGVLPMRGYTVEEAMSQTLEQSLTPESYQRAKDTLNDYLLRTDYENQYVYDEYQQPCKNGNIIDVELTASFIVDEHGIPFEILGVTRDITKRKRTENALRESEARLAKMLARQTLKNKKLSGQLQYVYDHTINAIAFFEIQDNVIRFSKCNYRWAAALNRTPEELEDQDIDTIVDEESSHLYHSFINKAIAKGESYQDYCIWKNKYLHVIVIPIMDETTGIFTQCAVLIYDFTERIEREQRFKESEQKFSNIFNHSYDAIIAITPELKVLEINKRFFELTGYNEPHVRPFQLASLERYIPQQYISTLEKYMGLSEHIPTSASIECEIICADGHLLPVEISSTRYEENGQNIIVAMMRDISLRKDFERQLSKVGTQIETRERRLLAADLHDNVGPLLSSMNMYLSSLSRKPELKPHADLVGDIRKILKEAITSVREISNNISPQVLTNYGLTSALQIFFDTKKNLISIEMNNNIGNLRFDEIKEIMVYNIIKELYNNTIKYAVASRIHLSIKEINNNIILQYSDNGRGFDIDEKLAEPSDKLGLFSIINRINKIDGTYHMTSAHGDGFLIEIVFPYK